ncbi:endoglucanase [Paractinoplanes brasiliensis]|uniref:Glucanase n=1 Tax=Paractinoplanes brasiliensis TaxID=52695 RepID=A0A4R6JAE8_9ACTN|nr:endoglucanase [Actinoplanes brasiliensis]GID27503.1 glucanase [Actinoplanes brasiliensis]
MLVLVLVLGVVAALAAVWLRSRPVDPVASPSSPPSAGPPALYVEPAGPAVEQVKAYEAAGRTADAKLIREIADRPVAAWFADETTDPAARARDLVTAAAAAGKVPVLTLYRIPQRDCGSHSGGGAATPAEYSSWVASIAAAIAGQRAVVIVEPDAVAQAVQGCLSAAERTERYRLLGQAIDTLAANPQLTIYLDGGNPSWITDPARMGDALQKAGVARADGFALNVANFETTAANIKYGTKLSKRLGGAHFVIDTSRNGNGPAKKTNHDGHWCNPPGRALGDVPTLQTGHELVDAYLWIKRPGESDGACGRGAPPAGQWWPDYALELARG